MFSLGREPDFAAPGGVKPVGSSLLTRPPAEDLEFLGKTYAREGAAFLACASLSCAACLGTGLDSESSSVPQPSELKVEALQKGDKVVLTDNGQIGEIYQVITTSKSAVVAVKDTNEMVVRDVSELRRVTNPEEEAEPSFWGYVGWRKEAIFFSLIKR